MQLQRTHLMRLLAAVFAALLPVCAGVSPPSFDDGMAWSYLVRQCSYGPRVPGSDAHRQAEDLIIEILRKYGAQVSLQRFELPDPYGEGSLKLVNIIGNFAPERKKRVLLAAHYDTRPRADQEEEDSLMAIPILGANDGASGVAALLSLAHHLGEVPPPGIGVDLVFFDGEDYGKEGEPEHYLLGSKHFAANLGGYHPACGILLDMVAGGGSKFYQEAYSLESAPQLTQELFRRAEQLGLEAFVSERGGRMYDDHVPLLLAGIEMVNLIGTPYRYWHTLQDTPEHCSKGNLAQTGTLLIDFLYNFPF